MIILELIFVDGIRVEVQPFFACVYLLVPTQFVEAILSLGMVDTLVD